MHSIRKYINIITENILNDENIVTFIKDNCQPFLTQCNGNYLYRGIPHVSSKYFVKATRIDRKSLSKSDQLHDALNSVIDLSGLVADRTNSVFVSGDKYMAGYYGALYIFLPVGDFNYTWSSKIRDAVTANSNSNLKKYINYEEAKQVFINTILPERIKHIENNIKNADLFDDFYINLYSDKIKYYEDPNNLEKIMNDYKCLLDDNNLLEYDLNNLAEYFDYKGNDGSLLQAMKSGHEIMIHCKEGLYINNSYWPNIEEKL